MSYFLVIENRSVKLLQIVLLTWEICLLPLETLNWETRWRRIRRIRKCLLSKRFTGDSCITVERQCRRELSVPIAPSGDIIYRAVKQLEETKNAWKMCEGTWTECICSYRRRWRCSTGGTNKKPKINCGAFSASGYVLNRHCLGSLLWWLLVVPIQNAADSAIVGRWNSETLRFCEGVLSATGGQSCALNASWFSDEALFHLDG
jgi:hypothetical protein